MTEGEWPYQMLLLIYLVVILSLKDCGSNKTGHIRGYYGLTTASSVKQPKLVIFSLDLVIWPFVLDQDVVTPVKKNKKTRRVQDFVLKDLGVYGHALDVLNTLYLKKYRMAAISDSPDVETNTKLLLFFNLYNYFPIQEIFGGPKKEHLDVIHRTTHIPYEDIFYFDVKNDQLDGLRKMGVQVIEVESGVEMKDFDRAMEIYNTVTPSPGTTSKPVS